MPQKSLAGLLSEFIGRTQPGHSARYLSERSAELFSEVEKIPHTTIDRWLHGNVKRPRAWEDVIKLGITLALSQTEMDQLLVAAKHPPFMELQEVYQQGFEKNNDEFSHKVLAMAEQMMIKRQNENGKPFQTPPYLFYYLERPHYLKKLQKRILSAACPSLITIQGLVGVGKTVLAKQLCYQLRSYFTDGVLWAQMDQSTPESILRLFAKSYGVDLYDEKDLYALCSHVRTILVDKHVLIVLDGVQNDSVLRAVLPPTGKSVVLMTTRRRNLSVADGGERVHLSPLEAEESLALFSQILSPSVISQAQDKFLMAAELLGHLPMTIQIAAHTIKHNPQLTIQSFLQSLNDPRSRLQNLDRGDQTPIRLLDKSYSLLDDETKQFCHSLVAIGQHGFTIDCASRTAKVPVNDAKKYLMDLYHHSLLDIHNSHYQLHPLIYDYLYVQRENGSYRKSEKI